MRTTAAAAGLLVALLALVPASATPASAAAEGVCARFGPGAVAGALGDPGLVETSGVVASRAHPDLLWAHNDSGGAPEVHALTAAGEPRGTYAVVGAEAVDWEDIAAGPGPDPGRSYLYVADTGDNRRSRPFVTVYRVAEPAAAPDGRGGELTGTEAFRLRYPNGPVDSEALLVDPRSGDLLLLTKELATTSSRVFRAPAASLRDGAEVTLEAAGRFDVPSPIDLTVGLPGWLVTGADVSPDGSIVLVRTYQAVLAYERRPGEALASAFTRPQCQAPQAKEEQGEAVAFAADGGSYVTIGEGTGVAVNRFAVAAAPEAAQERPPDSSAAPAEVDGAGDGLPWWLLVAAAAVVAAGVVVALRASGRGRAGRPRTRGSRRP